MAKWVHSDTLDGGLTSLKTNAVRMILISAYSAADSYATVLAAALATATISSADLIISSSGSNRVLTTASKSATASATAGGTPDLHIAFTDGSSKVLWVTDETSNQPITSGNAVNFPALTYTANQPT